MISPPEQPLVIRGASRAELALRCLLWQASAKGSYPGAERSRDAACLAADTPPTTHTASTHTPPTLPPRPRTPPHYPRTTHALPTHAHPTHAPHAPRGQGMTLVYALVVAITNGSDDHTPDHHSSSDAPARLYQYSAPLPTQRASAHTLSLL